MKKVTLFDRRYFHITNQQAEQLKIALGGSSYIDITSVDGKEYNFAPKGAILLIEPADGREIADLLPQKRQLPNRASMTDEQRAKNRKKLAEIRADFVARKAKRETARAKKRG